jgi:AraC-like DNA-binding protein
MSEMDKIKALFAKVPDECHLAIHSICNVKVPAKWEIKKRYIDDYHLLFVRGGHGTYSLDGKKVELERSRIVFVGGGAYYEGWQDTNDPPRIIPIRFGFYDNADGKQLRPLTDSLYYTYNSMNADKLEFFFAELVRMYNLEKSRFNDANISSLLHALLCRTFCEAEEDAGLALGAWGSLEKIKDWLAAHPLDRSDIGRLAEKAGISRKYFTTLFRRKYGISPKSYQVQQRMNYAKYMLQESDCSIKEAALQLGYSDQYIFSKQFKSIFGCPPSKVKPGK